MTLWPHLTPGLVQEGLSLTHWDIGANCASSVIETPLRVGGGAPQELELTAHPHEEGPTGLCSDLQGQPWWLFGCISRCLLQTSVTPRETI